MGCVGGKSTFIWRSQNVSKKLRVQWKEYPNQMQARYGKDLKSLIVYYSATGNTRKVADAIREALHKENVEVTLLRVKEAGGEDLYSYDLVFLGSPSIQALPADPVITYIKEKSKIHRERGDIRLCAPKMPGKTAVVFCTYSGPHIGINEAIPATKYMRQFLEHLGFDVAREWHIVGEFHGQADLSTKGKLGDIRGRPNEKDISRIQKSVYRLVRSILTAQE